MMVVSNAKKPKGLEIEAPHTKIDGEEVARLLSCGPAENERRNHGL